MGASSGDPSGPNAQRLGDAVGLADGASEEHALPSGESAPAQLPPGCMPMLMHIDLPEPLHPRTLILGEPVLQRYYTTFDSGAKRVGFGLARHDSAGQNGATA